MSETHQEIVKLKVQKFVVPIRKQKIPLHNSVSYGQKNETVQSDASFHDSEEC